MLFLTWASPGARIESHNGATCLRYHGQCYLTDNVHVAKRDTVRWVCANTGEAYCDEWMSRELWDAYQEQNSEEWANRLLEKAGEGR